MVTLFANGINTRFFTPQRGCRVFASQKSMVHEPGAFLGLVACVNDNKLHVIAGDVTEIYLWRFHNGSKNEWLEYGP